MANRLVPKGLKVLIDPDFAAVDAEREARVGGLGLDFDDIPVLLDDPSRSEWLRLSRVYADQPTRSREADRALVIAYCVYWSAFEQAARDVTARGVVVTGRSGKDKDRLVKNPSTVAMREAVTQVRYLANALGLSPDARGRIGITDEPAAHEDDDNPFAG